VTATGPRRPSVLITGGCGFIGSHLADVLIERGHRVAVIDDLSTGSLDNVDHLIGNPCFEHTVGTILDASVLERCVTDCGVVFHLAAAVGVDLIIRDPVHVIETNILGTAAVLKAAARHGAAVLLASSSEIYGKGETVPFEEDSDRLLGPTSRWRWSYATSKAVDEYLGLAYRRQLGLAVTVFRPFNTVGPRQTGHYGMVVPRFVQQALRGEPLTVFGDGSQTRTFCDVRDVVAALLGLMDAPDLSGQVFNIGSPEEITILDLAHLVLRLVDQATGRARSDTDSRIRLDPYDEAYEAGFEDMSRRVPDLGRIHDAIGWEPKIPFETTLRDIIAYERTRVERLGAQDSGLAGPPVS
jgi:UDP-glucose 4-epimerase